LVTTEVLLRGPAYVDIWVSVGFEAQGGVAVPQVREAIKHELAAFLSPLPDPSVDLLEEEPSSGVRAGWPLWKPVAERELLAVASRAPGVRLISDLLLGGSDGNRADAVSMTGLQLPRIAGLSVVNGDPVPLAQLTGQTGGGGVPGDGRPGPLPVPIIPEECR
jgi:hypothetical protein